MDSIYPRRESAFELGCNYWPRLSGPRMWRDFDEAQIAEELELIRASGMTTVRAFCFWPDFMPTKTRVEPEMLARLERFMSDVKNDGRLMAAAKRHRLDPIVAP